jgi:outer membrane protein assembly factor BamB
MISGMPVFRDGRIYVTSGGDIWWGRNVARIQCIDAAGQGDITGSGLVWSAPLERHCCTTPSVHEGLVYINDCGGILHCLDAATGAPVWTHDAGGEMWASTLVADGKVYAGTRRGDFWVLAAGREKKVLAQIKLDSAFSGMAAANGSIFIASMRRLHAVRQGAKSAPEAPPPIAR